MTPVSALVRKIREDHGDSLLDAEKRTGVSKSTIQRIEQGYACRDLVKYLQKIAMGYGVPVEVLVEASAPKGMFEGYIRSLSPSERLAYLWATSVERTKLLLDFVRARFPERLDPKQLAMEVGLPPADVAKLLAAWATRSPDRRTGMLLAQGMCKLTGISLAWFDRGWLDDELGPTERAKVYAYRASLRAKQGKICL